MHILKEVIKEKLKDSLSCHGFVSSINFIKFKVHQFLWFQEAGLLTAQGKKKASRGPSSKDMTCH